MANIKRLIFKRFGGTSNFVIFVLVTFVIYLLLRNYYFIESTESSNKNIEDGIRKIEKIHEHKIIELTNDAKNTETIIKKEEIIEKEQPEPPPQPKLKIKRGPIDPECVIDEKCSDEQVPFKIISGDGMEKYPSICFNGKLIVNKNIKDNKIGRGINFVLIDKDTLEVKSIDSFDTFNDDAQFLRHLKMSTADGEIVLIASYDEMANGLRESSIKFMENFGSQLFNNIKFRDSYVMIGQRGIAKGKAVELVEPKGNKDFASSAKITGCASFPMGVITPVKLVEMHVNSQEQIAVANVVKNCGLREECKANEFAVHVYTGKDDKDEPKICVDGRYVIAKGINDAGRGINIVLVGNGKEIIKTAHFDTYAEDSTNLEIFLEGLNDNVVMIAVTFDEASAKLGSLARNLFFDLGSGLIQNLRHRDAWFFVGRKGINGFSPIEEISYAGPDHAFPPPLDKRFCVPQTIKGLKIRPDPLPNMNDKRRDFCSRYDGYGDFCINENVDKPLSAAPLINKTLEDHPVYNTPILVIGAMSHNSLRMTLETVIMQPGIRPDLVYVCLDEKLDELASLVDLFGFQYVKIKSSFNYTEIYHKSLEKIWELVDKDKQTIIVIEEELILSPDFLYFFTQVHETFMNDHSLAAVSTWNPNSFLQLDGSPSLIYRTNDFPGFGYMLKRTVYDKFMRNRLAMCCSERAWYSWKTLDLETSNSVQVDVLMPDVSRVFRRPYDISSFDYPFLNNLFNRKRKTNLIPFPDLVDTNSFESQDAYIQFIKSKLQTALDFPNMNSCFVNGTVTLPTEKQMYYKVVFKQKDENDLSELKKLCKCFRLFFHETQPPKGLYLKSILRFNAHQNNFIFIGSENIILKS